jgi:hypothetical protein
MNLDIFHLNIIGIRFLREFGVDKQIRPFRWTNGSLCAPAPLFIRCTWNLKPSI